MTLLTRTTFVLLLGLSTALGQVNLVTNAGFAPGASCEGTWTGPCAEGFVGTVNLAEASLLIQSEGTNHVLHMSLPRNSDPGPHVAATWTGDQISAGATYVVSVRARSSALTGQARLVAVAEKDNPGSDPTTLASATVLAPGRTTTWIGIGLRIQIPTGTSRLRVALEGTGSCTSGACGSISFDELSVAEATGDAFVQRPYENVCAEGQYLDIDAAVCRDLTTNRGFSETDLAQALSGKRVLTLGSCEESAFRSLLHQAEAEGGATIRIPTCDLQLTSRVYLPNHLLLEGAGAGHTILRGLNASCDSRMLYVEKRTNVVIRDMTIIGSGCVEEPVTILYSDNVKLERTEIFQAKRNGLLFSYSERVTVRYNVSHETQQNNGLSTKDCYALDDTGFTTTDLCEKRAINSSQANGDVEPGNVWTRNYALYSNHVFQNTTDYGLALHATFGEVAGNLVEHNRRGIKLPDSQHISLHHNTIRENTLWGIHVYTPIIDRPPTGLVISHNRISRNGDFPIRLEGVKETYLIFNEYDANNQCYEPDNCWNLPPGTDALRIGPRAFGDPLILTVAPEVYACATGPEVTLPVFSEPLIPIENPACIDFVENVPPRARDDAASTLFNVPVVIEPLKNDIDADGDLLALADVPEGPHRGSIEISGSSITYTANQELAGLDSLRYVIDDGRGGTAGALIRINVLLPNRPPVAKDDTASTFSETAVLVDVLANDSDPDGDTIRISRFPKPPDAGTVVLDGGKLRYVSSTGFVGTDTFSYEINDGRDGVSVATVTITVAVRPNAMPVALDDASSTFVDTPVVIDVLANDSDPDADPVSLSGWLSEPGSGIVRIEDRKIVYTPGAGFIGPDSFRYEVTDGHGGVDTARVSLEVLARPNQAPVAANDSVTTLVGTPVTVYVLRNDTDPDGDVLTVDGPVSGPLHGSASLIDSVFVYTPEAGFAGNDRFSYAVSDGRGGQDQADVVVRVSTGTETNRDEIPLQTTLFGAFPNPTSGRTTLRYALAETAHVRIRVFDLLGKPVLELGSRVLPSGTHLEQIDVRSLPSGSYFTVLESGGKSWSRSLEVIH